MNTPLVPFYQPMGTHPPASSLLSKGRGVTDYILVAFTLPLLFKGRVGKGLRNSKARGEYVVVAKKY
jgi:hypothetical protein